MHMSRTKKVLLILVYSTIGIILISALLFLMGVFIENQVIAGINLTFLRSKPDPQLNTFDLCEDQKPRLEFITSLVDTCWKLSDTNGELCSIQNCIKLIIGQVKPGNLSACMESCVNDNRISWCLDYCCYFD